MVQHVGGVVGGEGPAGAELRVGEEKHEVLPLVADVVELEAEGGAEPVEEVGAEGIPVAGERRRRSGGCGGGSSLTPREEGIGGGGLRDCDDAMRG